MIVFRKTISLTSFLSFIILAVTSVVLYIQPHGRVAYWADWSLWGLSKTQWGDIHLTVGVLFLLCGIIHLWLNWKPVTAYMKNAARELVVFTRPMVYATLLTVFVTVGTLLHIPPMQQLMDLGTWFKDRATATYGNPPYGHAELSPLNKFCAYMGFDLQDAMQALKTKGFGNKVAPETPLLELAEANDATPQQVYEAIRGVLAPDPFAALPPSPPEGTGKMTLADICTSYGLPLDEALDRLSGASIKATPETTIKAMATASGKSPRDVYTILRNSQ